MEGEKRVLMFPMLGRTEVDEVELPALVDYPQLYVGMQAYSLSSGSEVRFDDLVFQEKYITFALNSLLQEAAATIAPLLDLIVG